MYDGFNVERNTGGKYSVKICYMVDYLLRCNALFNRLHLNILWFIMQINDRYEFPLELDLDREGGKYLSPDADKSVRNLYTLHRYQISIFFG